MPRFIVAMKENAEPTLITAASYHEENDEYVFTDVVGDESEIRLAVDSIKSISTEDESS